MLDTSLESEEGGDLVFTQDDLTAQALVVVDVQKAFITGADAVPDHRQLQGAVEILLENARAANVPVIFLQNDGVPGAVDEPNSDGWQLFFPPGVHEAVVRKSGDNGFDGTGLEDMLRRHGVRSMAICGMLSEMCLAATTRAALEKGFTVILSHDGHATYDVPAGPGNSQAVPARMAARAAEWSLGDEIILLAAAGDVRFEAVRRA